MELVSLEEAQSHIGDAHDDDCLAYRCRSNFTLVKLWNELNRLRGAGMDLPDDDGNYELIDWRAVNARQVGKVYRAHSETVCDTFTPDRDGYCENCAWIEDHHKQKVIISAGVCDSYNPHSDDKLCVECGYNKEAHDRK